MRHKRLKLCSVLLLVLGLQGLQAQESILTSGSSTLGSGGSVSYSIGQVVYTTNSGTSGSVSQGVQQPFEISVITGLEVAKGINLTISAYPNPATEFVKLKIDASVTLKLQSMSYQLFDNNGKLIADKKIEGNETSIDMKNLLPSSYYLKVIDSKKEVKSFKIIKY